MKNATELQLPLNYVDVDEEEMEYLDGGHSVSYNRSLLSKAGAAARALSVQVSKGWWKISTFDMAAEIFTHAVAFYSGAWVIAGAVGCLFGWQKAYDFARSIANGIDLSNGLDTRKFKGISYYQFYRAAYIALPG